MTDRGGGASLGTAQGRITVDASQAISSLNQLGSAMTSFDAKAAQVGGTTSDFTQSTVGLAQGMQHIGRVSIGLGATLAAPFAGAVKTAADFEQGMANVNAVMDITDSQFTDLSDLALQLGKDTVFSADEAALGIETLGKAGLDYESIMGGAAQAVTDLAAAGQTTIPRAAEVTAAAMNAFNLTGEDTVRIADAIAGAANASQSDVNQMGIGLAQVSGVAAAANMELEETAAFMAILADNGLSGSDAATSMKTAILALLSPTDKAAEEMANLGIELLDTEGNFVGLEGASREFFDAWKRSGQTMSEFMDPLSNVLGRDAVRTILFGMQAIESELTGIGKGFNDYEAAVSEAGVAQRIAEERMDSTLGAIERLRGSLSTLATIAGAPALEAFRPLIEGADALVDAMTNIPQPILAAAAAFSGIVGIVTAAGGAFLLVGGYILEATARLSAAGFPVSRLIGLLTRLVFVLGTVTAALGLLGLAIEQNWFGLGDRVKEINDQLGEIAKNADDATNKWRESGAESSELENRIYGLSSALAKSGIPVLRDLGKTMIASVIPAVRQARSLFDNLTRHGVSPLVAAMKAGARFLDISNLFGGDRAADILDTFADRARIFGDVFAEVQDSFNAQGINGFTSALFGLSEAWEVAFGPGRIPMMLEDMGQIIDNLTGAFAIFRDQGLNPVAAGLAAIADTLVQQLGMPGLAQHFIDAANAAQLFGDAFRSVQASALLDGMTGLSAAILGVGEALRQTTGIDITGFTTRLAESIEAANTAWQNARNQGINPFNAALDSLNAFMQTALADSPQLAEMWNNFTEGIGGATSAIGEFVGAGADRLVQFFNELGTAVSTGDFSGVLASVQSLISDITTELQSIGQEAITWAINVGIPELTGWAAENAGNAGAWIKEKLGLAADFAGEVLATVQGWVINVLTPTLTGWVDAAGAEIGPRIQAAANFAGQVLGNVQGWVLNVLTPTLQGFVSTAFTTVQSLLNEYLPKAGDVLGTISGWVLEVLPPTIEESVTGGLDIAQQLTDWVDEQVVFPNVTELPDIEAKSQQFGKDVGAAVVQFIQDGISGIFGGGGAGGAGTGGMIAGFGGTASLSNQFTQDLEASANDIGVAIIDGFLRGLGAGIAEALGQENLATLIETGDFEPLKTQITTGLQDAMADLKTDIESTIEDTKENFGGIFEGLLNINEWLDTPPAGGIASGEGFGAGGLSMADQFNTNLDNMVKELVQAVKDAFGGLGTKFTEAMELPANPFDALGTAISGWEDSIRSLFDGVNDAVGEAQQEFELAKTNLGRLMEGKGLLTQEEAFQLGTQAGVNSGIGFGAGYGEGFNDTSSKAFIDNVQIGEPPPVDPEKTGVGMATDNLVEAGRDFIETQAADSARDLGELLGEVTTREITNQSRGVFISQLPKVGTSGLASARDLDKTFAGGVAAADFAETKDAIADGMDSAAQQGVSQIDQQGASAADSASQLGAALASALAGSVGRADFTPVGQALQAKIGTALIAGVQEGDTSGVAGAAGGLGSSIASAMAGQIGAADFTAVGQALQAKIGAALVAGAAEGGGAATGQVAGAAGGLGASMAQAIAGQIGAADFTLVGQALQAKIGASLIAGMAEGGGTQIAGAAGGLGQSLAQAIAGQVGSADFSAVGEAISTAIGASLGTATGNLQSAMGAVMQAIVAAGQQAASQAQVVGSAIGQAIGQGVAATSGFIVTGATTAVQQAISAAQGIAAQGQVVGSALGQAIGNGVNATAGFVSSSVTTSVQGAISAGQGAAAGAQVIGSAIGQAIGDGVSASAGYAASQVQATVQGAIDAGVAAGAGAAVIGENIIAGIVAGLNSGAGAVANTVARIVSEGIAAGQAAANSSSPSKEAIERIGYPIAQGIEVGMESGEDDVVAAGRRLAEGAIRGAVGIVDATKDLEGLGKRLGAVQGLDSLSSEIEGIAGRIRDAADNARQGTRDMISGMKNELDRGAASVGRSAANLGNAVSSGMSVASGAGERPSKDQFKQAKSVVGDLKKMKADVNQLEALSNQLDKMRGFHDLGSQVREIAGEIETHRSSALDSAQGLMRDLRQEFNSAIREFRKAGKDVGDSISSGISEGVGEATTAATESTQSLTESMIQQLNPNLSRLPEMANALGTEAGSAVTEGLESSTPAATEAATGLGTGVADSLSAATPAVEEAATTLGSAGESVASGLEASEPAVETAATGVVDATTTAMDTAATEQSEFARTIGELISTTFGDGFASGADPQASLEMVKGYNDGIRNAVLSAVPQVQQQGAQIGSAFSAGIDSTNPTQSGKGLVDEAATGVNTGTGQAVNAANKAGSSIGDSLQSSIADACAPVNSDAQELTDSCIPKGIEAGENKASKVAQDAGENISDNLVDGLDVKKKDVQREFDLGGQSFGKSLASGIGGTVNDAVNSAQNVANRAGNVDASQDGKGVGTSFGQGIAQGIEQMIPAIEAAARKAVKNAEEAAKDEGKSKSPSELFAAIGRDLSLGMALGMERGADAIISASERMVQNTANVFSGAGVRKATREFDLNLDRYTSRIEDTVAFADRALSTDKLPRSVRILEAKARTMPTPQGGDEPVIIKAYEINGIVVEADSEAGEAFGNLIDALENSGSQYLGA